MSDYEPESVVDELTTLPDPFDTNIAAIKIWTDTNDPSESFDVLVSASVGADVVEISVDGSPLEVEVRLYQAEVSLKFARCSHRYGLDYEQYFGHGARSIDERSNTKRRQASGGSLKVGSGAAVGITKDGERIEEFERSVSGPEIKFEHHASNAIRFGNWRQQEVLSGQYVPHYKGWSVERDDPEQISGVLATLRVKKNWMDFEEVRAEPSSRLDKMISAVSGSSRESDKLKNKLFKELLKELTIRQLQGKDDTTMATLAMSGFIVRPRSDGGEILDSAFNRKKIEVPEALLIAMLSAPTGKEQETYNSLLRAAGSTQRETERPFTPLSGYVDAKRAYFELCIRYRESGQPFHVDNLNEIYGEPVVKDLRAIGAITSDRRNSAYFISPFSKAEPEYAFESLAMSQDTIKQVEELLRNDPETSAEEIGRVIGEYLGKPWSDGSAKRYGNQLRNWALRRQSSSRGRSFVISGMTEEFVHKLEKEGKSAREIGKLLNMSTETVYRHFRANKNG